MSLAEAAGFGVAVPAETLSDMMSVTIDASWQLTPTALGALVDHLGGVTVDVAGDITVNSQVVLSAGRRPAPYRRPGRRSSPPTSARTSPRAPGWPASSRCWSR